ncbi:MAG TPA: hypothetical protein ENI23_11815 [bacterium]|nr:hypothetical protein [bacterium]
MTNKASLYRGVYKNGKRWVAKCGFEYQSYCLGTFDKEYEAGLKYDEFAKKVYGDKAILNFCKHTSTLINIAGKVKGIRLKGGYIAWVDDESFPNLSRFNWSIDGCGYPQAAIKTTKGLRPVRMHRVILGLVGREMGDHKNGDRLDNTLCNLRKCNQSENTRNKRLNKNNTTGFKGVYYNSKRGKYQADINVDYKHKFLGAFDSAVEAARCYDRAALKYFDSFALTNADLNLY